MPCKSRWYAEGQILVLTYPLIGNYGVPPDETDELGIPRTGRVKAAANWRSRSKKSPEIT